MNERHSPIRFRFSLPMVSKIAVVAFFLAAAFGIGPSSFQPFYPEQTLATHCGGGAQCNAVTPHLCQGECKSTLTCASDGILKLISGSCGLGVSPLSISNINVANITSSNATITWTTNKVADARVNYGLTSSYGTTAVSAAPDSTSHSVTLTGLEASTTYHYQVESKTPIDEGPVETARSTDRTFLTSSGGSGTGGSGPTITFGPRVDATNDRATVVFNTSPDTAAMVEYTTDPGSAVLSAKACDAGSPCPSPPPALPTQVSGAHSILLTGLTQANSEYRYKITIVDSVGSVFVTNEFTFRTSSSSTDHVFSTGGCNDNTPIGQCNLAGQYCRPGGGAPVYDCRPDIPCPKQCGTGSTCQSTGDCTEDPALTGSPTQCNQGKCYQKCNNQSGRLSAKACTIDSNCVDTKGTADPNDDARGRCVAGSFTNPAAPGCIASWPSCDANVILKVRPDRVCEKWLTCKTSVPVKDESGKTENQCFDLSICNSLSLAGQCNKLLEGRQCSNDPLRFCALDSDCLAGGECYAAGRNIPITYNTPSDVSKIQNLSGYAKAGLHWNTVKDSPRIEGFYPLSVAPQVGNKVVVPNGDFEQTRTKLVCSNNPDVACTNDTPCGTGSCNRFIEDENFYAKYWDPLPAGRSEGIVLDREGTATNLNRFLLVTPTKNVGSGATTTSEMGITTQSNAEYLLSVRMKSLQGGGFCSGKAAGANDDGKTCTQDGQCSSGLCGGQHIKVSLKNDAGVAKDFATVVLSTGWRTFHLGPIKGPSGITTITFTTTAATDPVDFWIDDVALLPALKVNDTDQGLIVQNCRLYPKDDAPACDFTDENSITYRGLKGYCLERDPLNTAVCLSWWPVDILSGENIFGQDAEAGYSGRRPLYYCAEAAGNSAAKNSAYDADWLTPYRFQSLYGTVYACSFQGNPCNPGDECFQGRCVANTDYTVRAAFRARAYQPASRADAELRETDIAKIQWNHVWGGSPGSYATLKIVNDAQFQSSSPSNPIRLIEASPDKPYVVFRTTGPVEGGYGAFNTTERNIVWVARDLGCNEASGFDVCVATAAVIFDKSTGKLLGYVLDAWATPWSTWRDLAWREFLAAFKVQISARETCNTLVRVATDTQDAAWVNRTSTTSTYTAPDLNYRYPSDLAPLAGAAAPSNIDEPSSWTGGPLIIEGPDRNLPNPPAFQARGGGAYACDKNCQGRVCVGAKDGQQCLDSSECVVTGGGETIQGSCTGNGFCLKYDAIAKTFSGSKKACKTNADCTTAGEECIGGAASNRGTQTLNSSVPSGASINSFSFAQYRLMRLFTKVYGLWTWNPATGAYKKDDSFTSWNPPTALCKVCSGTSNSGKACITSTDCGSGSTCVDTPRHPTENAGSQSTADYCAIKPSLTNVVDAGKPVGLGEGSSYILKFNSNIDREQRPLRRITINWGDCDTNRNCVTNDDNLRIAPRDDPNNPHAYTHVYHCGKTDGSTCTYQVLLQIADNWDWCDNGVDCNSNTNTWIKGPRIEVSP